MQSQRKHSFECFVVQPPMYYTLEILINTLKLIIMFMQHHPNKLNSLKMQSFDNSPNTCKRLLHSILYKNLISKSYSHCYTELIMFASKNLCTYLQKHCIRTVFLQVHTFQCGRKCHKCSVIYLPSSLLALSNAVLPSPIIPTSNRGSGCFCNSKLWTGSRYLQWVILSCRL